MSALETVQATSGPIGNLGSAFYFAPPTLKRGKELGLDGFRFYILGRGGVLGDVEPAVVQSAFGYFHADTIAKIWTSAAEKLAPREAGTAYHLACAEFGRQLLADVEGLDGFIAAAEEVVAHADPAGLALFAGIAAEPRVDDAPGRAMQLAAILRELRGSFHIVALLATGFSPAVAHALKRPDMVATFGWDPAPVIGDDAPAKAAEAEALTDKLTVEAYSTLDADARAAFVAGVEAMAAALEAAA